MLSLDLLFAALLCAAARGYLVYVNRPRQWYESIFILDIPVEEAWNLLSLQPGFPQPWIPGLRSVEWRSVSGGEIVSRYENGTECHTMLNAREAPFLEESANVFRPKGSERFGDVIICRMTLQPMPEGTAVQLVYFIKRSHLTTGFLMRLNYPRLGATVETLLRNYLMQQRPGHRADTVRKPFTDEGNLVPRSWTKIGLAGLSVAALAFFVGWDAALAITATVAVHEYGHTYSLRRHGHRAQFYLIPLFGGVAIGSRTYESDAEACEVLLMGPAFGLFPPLACLATFAALGDDLWLRLGFITLLVNMFNLLPIPPLDGGRVAQAFLKLLGNAVWFGASGLLILLGGILALYMDSKSFLVLLILGAVFWGMNREPLSSIRPLNLSEGSTVTGAYLALAGMHVAALMWCDSFFNGNLLRALFRI